MLRPESHHSILNLMDILITIAIRLLESMFILGLLGSAIVLILSGVEDVELLLGFSDSEDH
jgi:hypothetical protein